MRSEWWGNAVTPPVTEQLCFFCEKPSDQSIDICTSCAEEHGPGLLDTLDVILTQLTPEPPDETVS